MFKKSPILALSLLVACLLASAVAAAPVMAQSPNEELTSADIDFFVKLSTSPPEDWAKISGDSGMDPAHYAAVSGKIGLFGQVNSMSLDDAQKKSMLENNPAISISQAELDLLNSRAADIAAALAALAALPQQP